MQKLIIFAALAVAGPAAADVHHYMNLLQGDRAAAMGGAYAAIADDPSAAHYNPAGAARARGVSVSASVNAYYHRTDSTEGLDLVNSTTTNSTGSVPIFLGSLLRPTWSGAWTVGFALYQTDDSQIDEERETTGTLFGSSKTQLELKESEDQTRFVTFAARPLAHDVSIGFGLGGYRYTRKRQSFTYSHFQVDGDDGTPEFLARSAANDSSHVEVIGPLASVGARWDLDAGWSLGASVSKPFIERQSIATKRTRLQANTDAKGEPLPKEVEIPAIDQDTVKTKTKNAIHGWPGEARLGVAWRTAPAVLQAFDAIFHEGAGSRDLDYRQAPTWNVAYGAEVRVHPSLKILGGLFTNRDATVKEVDLGGLKFELAHNDFYGASLGLATLFGTDVMRLTGQYQEARGTMQDPFTKKRGTTHARSMTGSFAVTKGL